MLGSLSFFAQAARTGSLITEHLTSNYLRETRSGVDPTRSISVYLPPDYAEKTTRTYPVIYYFHGLGSSNTRLFADGNMQKILDRAIAAGVTKEFILVAADYSAPTGCFF